VTAQKLLRRIAAQQRNVIEHSPPAISISQSASTACAGEHPRWRHLTVTASTGRVKPSRSHNSRTSTNPACAVSC
jgi:hypothetical protein